jgi:hypothetical protein
MQTHQINVMKAINRQLGLATTTQQIQKVGLKTAQTTAQAQKTIERMVSAMATPAPTTPAPITPPPVKPITPVFPPFWFGFDMSGASRPKKEDYLMPTKMRAYLPSFTVRALGLAPVKIKKGEGERLLRQLQTGLELRKGVIIK